MRDDSKCSISILAIFAPLIGLALIQIFCIPFDFYSPEPSIYARLVVLSCYMAFLSCIATISYLYRSKYNFSYSELCFNSTATILIKTVILVLSLVYLNLTFEVAKHGALVGYEYIRYEYFYNQEFRAKLFGGIVFDWVFNIFILPVSWLIVSLLTFSKKYNFFYWFLLIAMVVYNVSIGGRFTIYYAMIFVYFRFCYFNRVNFFLVLKIATISIVVVMVSIYIVSLRVDDFDFSSATLSVLEYHTSPPFFLMDKVDDDFGDIWFKNFPLYSIFSSFPLSIAKLVGLYNDQVPYYYLTTYLNDFTIVSNFTGFKYNAFSTVFVFFIMEFGVFAPFFVFFYFFVLFSLPIVVKQNYRLTVTAFIVVFVFFSLFRYEITTPGFQFLLFIIMFLVFFKRLNNRLVRWHNSQL